MRRAPEGGRRSTGRRIVGGAAVLALLAPPAAVLAAPGGEPQPFRAMVERPLFSPTRRPPPPPPPAAEPFDAPAAPAPQPSPDVSLSGVIAGGGGGVALLKRPGDAAPVRVALGGTVDGWTLAEVRPRAVVLRRDGRSVTVELPGAR